MVTREETIRAANYLFQKHCNDRVHDAYRMAFRSNLDGLLKTVILDCLGDSVYGGKISVKDPVEFSVVLRGHRKLEKEGYLN